VLAELLVSSTYTLQLHHITSLHFMTATARLYLPCPRIVVSIATYKIFILYCIAKVSVQGQCLPAREVTAERPHSDVVNERMYRRPCNSGPLPHTDLTWLMSCTEDFSFSTGLIPRTLGPSNDFTLLSGWICLYGVLG